MRASGFSETTNMIKTKLYMNVHWMVLYKLYVFCSDMKFKMAATAGLSLTLDPMGKMFPNASLNPLGQLKPNCPGMIIGRSSTKFVFYVDRKSKMSATVIHRLTLDPKTREFRVKLNFAAKNSRTFYPELSRFTVSSIFQMTSRCR